MTTTIDPVEIRSRVARAARTVNPTWPLHSFIATNPLSGFERRPFLEVIADPPVPGTVAARSLASLRADLDSGHILEHDVRTAVALALPEAVAMGAIAEAVTAVDVVLAALRLPVAEPAPAPIADSPAAEFAGEWLARLTARADAPAALYSRFHSLAAHDASAPRTVRARIRALPSAPEQAIAELAAPPAELAVHAALSVLPGWASHLAGASSTDPRMSLTDLAAIVLAAHHAFGVPLPGSTDGAALPDVDAEAEAIVAALPGARGETARRAVRRVLALLPVPVRLLVAQTAAEVAYRRSLFGAIAEAGRVAGAGAATAPAEGSAGDRREVATSPAGGPEPALPVAATQAVFCIDTRSEGMRRHLEAVADVETFGFAGFFALPLEFRPLGSPVARQHYPALLSGGIPVSETAGADAAARRTRRDAVARATEQSRKAGSSTPLASFVWAEAAGWFDGLAAATRTLAPGVAARRREEPSALDVCERLTLDEQVDRAEAVVRMMGLDRVGELIVFVGHHSTTTNNLYRAALDCGACGGNSGAPNARAVAAIFGNPAVRKALRRRGIDIPESTVAIAAVHDTSRDVVEVLDEHLVPESHREAVARFVAQCAEAGRHLTAERASDLPGASPSRVRAVQRRADDWAETYPELGLAGNAALVIGPRSITRGADLGRRVFLHSYDAALDPDAAALEAIMTGPLVVAQWINHQYYFSALNPHVHGAGNKNLHNPIGTLGVWAGYGGDLRVGLPWQSVAVGSQLLHEPLRLSVLIQAPLPAVARIVSSNDALHDLLDNDWITLHARAAVDEPWQRYTPYGFRPSIERTRG